MAALKKADLAEYVSENCGLNKSEAKDLVEDVFQAISETLIRGEEVKISGFGNWTTRDKRQRPGRNPRTGEEIPISARRVVTFRAGQKLKSQVESYQGTRGEEESALR